MKGLTKQLNSKLQTYMTQAFLTLRFWPWFITADTLGPAQMTFLEVSVNKVKLKIIVPTT